MFMRHEILLAMLIKICLFGFDAAYFSRHVISLPLKCWYILASNQLLNVTTLKTMTFGTYVRL